MDDSAFEKFVSLFKTDAGKSGFVLDFDGTLSRIVPEPGGALLVEGGHEVLMSLSMDYKRVAMVSGRLALDLRSVVTVPGIEYVGLYGAERLIDERLFQPPDAERWRGMASRLARDAEVLILTEGLEGAVVEYKDLAVSVHYRNASDPAAGEIIREWAAAAAPKRGFDAGVGRMVVEMRPAGISKASALEQVISESELAFVVCAGDDYQDVKAMRRAHEVLGEGALAVGVASNEEPEGLREASDVMVFSPLELVELLRKFLLK
jgi:trehalose 6-phosphate phosphatase